VDALRNAHSSLLRVAKVYGQFHHHMVLLSCRLIGTRWILYTDSEPYDYPTQINESVTETATNISHTLTSWAAAATKGYIPPRSILCSNVELIDGIML
jgi:hypothetical protein